MANRVMQQKKQKMKRERRAWARPLSIAGGKTPAKGVIQEYKERAKGLGIDEAEVNRLILQLYGHLPFTCTPAGIAEMKQKGLDKLVAELKEIVPQLYFFTLIDNCYQRCRVYFNAQKTCFIIVHDDLRRKVIRRSIEYHDKDLIVSKWHSGKITWIRYSQIQSGTSPSLIVRSG